MISDDTGDELTINSQISDINSLTFHPQAVRQDPLGRH